MENKCDAEPDADENKYEEIDKAKVKLQDSENKYYYKQQRTDEAGKKISKFTHVYVMKTIESYTKNGENHSYNEFLLYTCDGKVYETLSYMPTLYLKKILTPSEERVSTLERKVKILEEQLTVLEGKKGGKRSRKAKKQKKSRKGKSRSRK
jgi:hypothetical protein